MLQRTKENSCPLSTDTVISCNFKPHQVDNHQCPSCPEKLPEKETLKQAKQIHFDQDRDSQRQCAFKFSISRLPKWARDKVIPPGSIRAGPTALSKVLELKLTVSLQFLLPILFFSYFSTALPLILIQLSGRHATG